MWPDKIFRFLIRQLNKDFQTYIGALQTLLILVYCLNFVLATIVHKKSIQLFQNGF